MSDKGNKGHFKPGDPRVLRRKGSANKATQAVREAIALIAASTPRTEILDIVMVKSPHGTDSSRAAVLLLAAARDYGTAQQR